ncbi:MAG: T9SS type A sorting domain-containing protein [Ignavibacteriaceae bacterium]|nr:T9SS type A sorting domain-containing protein [Ignavibacteriaceae bacterium]
MNKIMREKYHPVLLPVYLLISFLIMISVYPQQGNNESYVENLNYLNWGYNYDSTLVFLESIHTNPFVKIDSIGASVQGRAIWMITIKDTSEYSGHLFRVTIHARTHPAERQSQWLTQKMVEQLIGNSEIAAALRKHIIFNVVPMYNPDGVELNIERGNANGVDLERNWFVSQPEPEVLALRNKYIEFMNDSVPIKIALNMHGDAGSPMVYFVYHHENGTSIPYTVDEKYFISLVRSHWVDGIADWNYNVTWSTGNPLIFPECWFWVNYQKAVLALTNEQIFVSSKNDTVIIKTANALLNGIADYLGAATSVKQPVLSVPNKFQLFQNYPNPFNPSTTINYFILNQSYVSLIVYDALGREIIRLVDEEKPGGNYSVEFKAVNLASGIYFYKLQTEKFTQIKKMILLR